MDIQVFPWLVIGLVPDQYLVVAAFVLAIAVIGFLFLRWRSFGNALVGLALVSAIVSPLVLERFLGVVEIDWALLSDIGQSYGVMSAWVAAIGLLVLAASVRSQVLQTRISQMQAARMMQLELTRLAMDHPVYRHVFGRELGLMNVEEWRFRAYLNLWMMHLQMLFLTGSTNEKGVRRVLLEELFNNSVGPAYWEASRSAFEAECTTNAHVKFLRVVDEAFAEAASVEGVARRGPPFVKVAQVAGEQRTAERPRSCEESRFALSAAGIMGVGMVLLASGIQRAWKARQQ